jgi:hypothetical protein
MKRTVPHPISKAGTNEYHPIFLLRHIGNVAERILTLLLESEVQLGDNQFGCRSGISAIDSARLAQNLSAVTVTQRKKSAGVLLDISKAYHRVHTGIFLGKLRDLHKVLSNLLAWLHSWISRRALAVRFDGALASFSRIQYGLPQGSPLRVIIFRLFLDDIMIFDTDLLFREDCALFASDAFLAKSSTLRDQDIRQS